ncbi:DoxX family protein [Larsenimonas suaedae]|uniref:DoxX family protein n=1 Tax=Larsenimonas suaedae TaxID=1851019 RepID=A0ABU1GST9_9GAMM|nr:DoxX family protein [Larsenimonas suaedae]MCM2972126.1 DoxX family protein [Larsenimonas suaedae]MDR5895080.1 DoxX family protein [Larsenimonas suaedae]
MKVLNFKNDALGKLLLRTALGFTVLLHGVAKVGDEATLAHIGDRLTLWHLPDWLCYAVFIGELVAPVLILLGAYVRMAALLIAIDLVAAIALFQLSHVFELGSGGGWRLEREAMWLFGALALVCLGGGRYGLRPD